MLQSGLLGSKHRSPAAPLQNALSTRRRVGPCVLRPANRLHDWTANSATASAMALTLHACIARENDLKVDAHLVSKAVGEHNLTVAAEPTSLVCP